MMGATGLGRDGAASLRMMKNLLTEDGAPFRLGENVAKQWADALLKANELRPGATGATGAKGAAGAMGNDNSTSTWIFGAKPIDDAFGLSVKDADGKDTQTRLEDAGGRYNPSPSAHAKLSADVVAEIARERRAADAESERRAMPPILGYS